MQRWASVWRGAVGKEHRESVQNSVRLPKDSSVLNTYRLEPLRPVRSHVLRMRAEPLLERVFRDLKFQDQASRTAACTAAQELLTVCTQQNFSRYRYVVQVSVGEKQRQSVQISSRALWDQERDDFITLNYENRHLFVVGIVFAVYMD